METEDANPVVSTASYWAKDLACGSDMCPKSLSRYRTSSHDSGTIEEQNLPNTV
ncbi:MAG: hypothetical protein WA876_14740 [Candidatus Acidiferrales bacterium]